jgi:nitrate/nitrite transporter NarK
VWSDSDLRRTRDALPPHTDRDPRNLAAGLVLVFFAPLVAMLPLLRAAETSRAWEIAAWCLSAAVVAWAAVRWRAMRRAAETAKSIEEELRLRENK